MFVDVICVNRLKLMIKQRREKEEIHKYVHALEWNSQRKWIKSLGEYTLMGLED